MKAWHRSEPETIRPFFAMRAAENALDNARIVCRPGDDPQLGPVIALEDHEWAEIAPCVLPSIDAPSLLAAVGPNVESLNLALLVRDPTFKRRRLLKRWPLTGALPERIEIEREWLNDFGHEREMHLTLAVCLVRALPDTPGLPTIPGSWICQKTFELRQSQLQSQFPVEELTEERANRFGIDQAALLFVDYLNDINEIDENAAPVARAYVNADVYRRLTSGSKSEALLALLEAEIVSAVILAASEDITEADGIEDDGPLDRILRNLSEGDPMPLDGLKRLLRDAEAQQKIRAAVFAATGACLTLSKV